MYPTSLIKLSAFPWLWIAISQNSRTGRAGKTGLGPYICQLKLGDNVKKPVNTFIQKQKGRNLKRERQRGTNQEKMSSRKINLKVVIFGTDWMPTCDWNFGNTYPILHLSLTTPKKRN